MENLSLLKEELCILMVMLTVLQKPFQKDIASLSELIKTKLVALQICMVNARMSCIIHL